MTVDSIVAGAGIWGCTVARRLAEAGRKVLVLEKRPVVGGNVRCEIDEETGIEIHKYGSHIFHTHIPEVWEFVNRFVKFNGYQHKVLAWYQGKTYFLPLGLALINKFFGIELKPGEVADFMADEAHSKAIFDAFFRGYTSKQWGKPPEEIDPSIIKRVPVRSNYDVNYFNDYNQGIPLTGYNSLFERLLDHPNIEVRCNAEIRLEGNDLKVGGDDLPNVPVYYSGPIDALFDYRFGHLPWRTLRLETEKLAVKDYQGTSVVNYTEANVPYTRIHEFKHYHPEQKDVMECENTIIMREYSASWKLGDEPYYPIDNAESRELLAKYQSEAVKVEKLVVGGRLGGYKYYDMDRSIEASLKVALD
ncbi:MAG: NAD(P)-binding protein [Kiritimatiellae bacterium]|nr:NAD(P)-binding protein [Kiritimatiellia bacterium]